MTAPETILATEGPSLHALMHRLSECPPDFLAQPLIAGQGQVHVAAVVSDVLRDLESEPLLPWAAQIFQPDDGRERNRLRATLIACWLLHDEWFRARQVFALPAYRFLSADLAEVAAVVDAPQWVSDVERREELVRLILQALALRPAGETIEYAQDRLTTLSTVVRYRVLEETRAAQQRAREIREAMQRKAAEEAAAKYTRE